jgi:hypothetical protein
MTTPTRTSPLVRIRVIGPADCIDQVLTHVAEHAATLLGAPVSCRRQTRHDHPAGHVRAYFTITRKEHSDRHD